MSEDNFNTNTLQEQYTQQNQTSSYGFQAPPPPPPPPPPSQLPHRPKKKGGHGCLIAVLIVFLVFLIFGGGLGGLIYLCTLIPSSPVSYELHLYDEGTATKDDSSYIAVLSINGIIMEGGNGSVASSSIICRQLHDLCADPNLRAIILDMNTPGGSVVPADEIHSQVLACRAAGIPVVTCMRSVAASGGYFIAAGTDWIIANRLTLTGSIGVIMESYQVDQLMNKIGVSPVVYKSGALKDIMSPTRSATLPEQALLQSMVNDCFTEFCQVVADGRKAFNTADDVKASIIGDGRVVSGAQALEIGLVDQLGGFDNAVEVARKLGHCPDAKIFCVKSKFSFSDIFSAALDTKPAQVQIQGLPNGQTLMPGCMYYVAPELL